MQQQQFTRDVQWMPDKDFVSPYYDSTKGGPCVFVNILPLEFPRYSYALGWKLPDGTAKLHFQGNQIVDPILVQSLLSEAQIYIKSKVADVETMRAQREADQQRRVSEEAQRKLQKKKRYEANVATRREENRARAARR